MVRKIQGGGDARFWGFKTAHTLGFIQEYIGDLCRLIND